ncbi:MAG: PP2C family protein-serine/threonine phosphatase [Gammaproteobacteria bacterium]
MTTFHGDTHPGRVHDHNEDSIGWNLDQQVWLVADGMGGHASGEVASKIVADTILEKVASQVPLAQCVLDAHQAVIDAASGKDDLDGMGSTVVSMQIRDGECDVVWVGDSRAYLWRGGRIERISRDHSFVELLREGEEMSETEVRGHPQRNVVIQTLGMGGPTPGHEHLALQKRDWLILCSDGLNDELTDDEISYELKRSADPKEAVGHLIQAALDHGGRDNVSVVIVESETGDRALGRALRTYGKPLTWGMAVAVATLLVLRWLGLLG